MQPMTMPGASEAISAEPVATKSRQMAAPRSHGTGIGSTNVGSAAIAAAERTLRADAARNRRRVLSAAAQVFGERGLAGSIDEIARAAGVGVGTVYRRFPSTAALVDAVFEDKVENMVIFAGEAAAFDDPWQGFVYFIRRSLDWQVQNRGLRAVRLRRQLPGAGAARTRDTVAPILTAIIERAQVTGKLRPDVVVGDVLMLVTMLVAVFDYVDLHDPELGPRYLALMLDGLVSDRAAWTPLTNHPPVQALLMEPDPAA
jgi:AcrR family transcriptional regulator